MTIKYFDNFLQGSDEWFQARCGLLTASEIKRIVTAKNLTYSKDKKTKLHVFELLAQRLNNFVEPSYVSDDMIRGTIDEIEARSLYVEKYNKIIEHGFITNDKWGFTIGYSPDGLIESRDDGETEGDFDGVIEIKSRLQKHQASTFVKNEMPDDYSIQVQTGLLVTERKFCDFISYCGGMPMFVKRVYADEYIQDAIVTACGLFEKELEECKAAYLENSKGMYMTERVDRNEDGEIESSN